MAKHLTKRGYTFWYRRRMKHKGEIVFSLGTKNYDLAILRHSYIDYKINELIIKGLFETMDTQKIRDMIDDYKDFVKSDDFIYGEEGESRGKALELEINGEFFGGHTKTALLHKLTEYGQISQSDNIEKVKEHTNPIIERNSTLSRELNNLDDEKERNYFHWKVLKAEVWALNKAIQQQDKYFGRVEQQTQMISNSPRVGQSNSISIGKLTKKYMGEKSTTKEWSDKNERDIKFVLELLEEYFTPRTANDLIRDDFVKFRDEVLTKLPQRIDQNAFHGKDVKDIIEMTHIIEKDEEGKEISKREIIHIGRTTINKHIGRVNQVFAWAADEANILEHNYCSKLRIVPSNKQNAKRKKTNKLPFTTEELKEWFEVSPYFTTKIKTILREKPQFIFIPLLALYTGARNAELAQLHHKDIKKINDVWCIHITDLADDATERKQVKNSNSIRVVPIAKGLIDVGFLEYVNKQKNKLLFPSIKYYDNKEPDFTTRVSDYIRRYITKDKNKTFYSFRHLVNQKLKNGGAELYHINDITGHSDTDIEENPINIDVYGDEQMPVEILKEVIDRCLVYNEIDFSHIKEEILKKYK